MKKNQKKKKHHYVPRFYLGLFLDKNRHPPQANYLWVIEKYKNNAFRKSPENIAFENYFYSIDESDANDSNIIEDMLSKVESDVSKIFRDIKNGNIDFKCEKKRFTFSQFICLMHHRTVKAKELLRILAQNIIKSSLMRDVNKIGGLSNYLRKQGIKDDISNQEFIDVFNRMKLVLPKETFLNFMIMLTIQIIPFLYERNWCFITPESGKRFFITSDNPVLLYNSEIKDSEFIPGLAFKNTDIFFPISPRVCLCASFSIDEGKKEICDADVVFINRKIANNCNRYIFANTDNLEILFAHPDFPNIDCLK